MKKKHYRIVSARNPAELMEIVNEALELGYQPLGGPVSPQRGTLHQALYGDQIEFPEEEKKVEPVRDSAPESGRSLDDGESDGVRPVHESRPGKRGRAKARRDKSSSDSIEG